jgi:trimeric autotransporter adhesin
MIDPHGREEMKRGLSHCLLFLALAVSGVMSGITTDTKAQSQRARQGPQTPAPIPGPIVQPSATFPLKQVGYINASNPNERAQFGDAVALSGDGNTLAVGARAESSAAAGINGNQADASAPSSGAVYVFARLGDRWLQQAYLKASNPGINDQFGSMVGLSADGNTLAVSAYFEDSRAIGVNGDQADNSIEQSGAVYVFARTGAGWSQQAYLKASNTGEADEGDQFGFSLALSDDGNTLAAGAMSEDSADARINGNQADNSASNAGAVYVFVRAGTRWSQQAYIKSSSPNGADANDLFGYSVGLSADGNTLAVGSYDEAGSSNVINGPEDNNAPGTGAVFVFTRSGTSWSRQAYLKASTQDPADSLGAWVAISDDGNTVAAGAPDEDSLTTGINTVETGHSGRIGTLDDISVGAAYVFVRSGATWSQQASFKASNSGIEDWFGVRLALSGDGNTLAVSAPNEDGGAKGINGRQDDNSAGEAGAVYLFTRAGTTWTFQSYVKGSNTEAFDEFGSGVALSRHGTLAVGARSEDGGVRGANGGEIDNSVTDSGTVYLFNY